MKKRRATSTMEAVERSHPHQTRSSSSGGGAGDFFICFSARPSSSSVASASSAAAAKRAASTKTLMSPGRSRDSSSAPALSASLSRRLRSSGSVKGGQSPMFPSGVPLAGRKKGCAFEAAEPSSPKVTCIGQVRVKAKKKVKSSSAMARSRSRRGRECCSGRNQSWVHQLPLSICEALRGIGSEFNCFVPCGGRTGKEKGMGERRMVRSASSSSCGAVVAKWLLAVQENEEEAKGAEKVEVGFLVRERGEERVEIEEMGGEKGEILVVGEMGEEAAAAASSVAGRVSVCIPPRNALLLMRCRSDPVKMAALANRFWGSPATEPLFEEEVVEEEEEDDEMEEEEIEKQAIVEEEEVDAAEASDVSVHLVKEVVDCEKTTEEENNTVIEEDEEQHIEEKRSSVEELSSSGFPHVLQAKPPVEAKEVANAVRNQAKKLVGRDKAEEVRILDERKFGTTTASRSKEKGRRRWKEKDGRRHSFSAELDPTRYSFSSEREAKRASFSIDNGRRWSFSLENPDIEKSLTFAAAQASPEKEKTKKVTPEVEEMEEGIEKEVEEDVEEVKKEETGECAELPDCLLMMMYEPKLSMEVSKETWVCGNDFVRWRPPHTRNSNAAPPPPPPPPPQAAAAETVVSTPSPTVQHKLSARPAAVAPYEPLVLTRCKSEPVRSSARLAPDACFWKERHRPIGAAGIGF